MNIPAVVAEIDAMVERLRELRERLVAPEQSVEQRLPAYVRAPAYARARGYTPEAVRKWCSQGMPHLGAGKALRVDVVRADAWLRDGGPQRARDAAGLAGRAAAAAKAMQ